MRPILVRALFVVWPFATALAPAAALAQPQGQGQGGPRVQIAVVVDVSQSLRGFTDAMRQRVIALVDKLAQGTDAEATDLALVAFGYGDDAGVRVLAPLSPDWEATPGDLVFAASSDQPASLARVLGEQSLSGGSEGCGRALETARFDLEWSEDQNSQRFVIIAGNEDFNQTFGPGAKSGVQEAREYPRHFKLKLIQLGNGRSTTIRIEMPITLHTIHAGPRAEAERHQWKQGAALGGGSFDNVDPGARR